MESLLKDKPCHTSITMVYHLAFPSEDMALIAEREERRETAKSHRTKVNRHDLQNCFGLWIFPELPIQGEGVSQMRQKEHSFQAVPLSGQPASIMNGHSVGKQLIS